MGFSERQLPFLLSARGRVLNQCAWFLFCPYIPVPPLRSPSRLHSLP